MTDNHRSTSHNNPQKTGVHPPTPVTLQPITPQALERVKLMMINIAVDLLGDRDPLDIVYKRMYEYLDKEIEISKMEG